MASVNDSPNASFVRGDFDGYTGARERLTDNGPLDTSNKGRLAAMTMGLPQHIRGDPLGCGCSVAHLSAVGQIQTNGEIEADYQCDSSWHNYVIFQLKVKQAPAENEIRIDKDGNLVEDAGKDYDAPGLETL